MSPPERTLTGLDRPETARDWPADGALARGAPAAKAHPAATWAPRALFWALLVLGVLPVWVVAHVPTQDGGNHVESILTLLALPHSAFLQRHFLANWGPQPNWLTQLLFMGLVQLVNPRLAEKLVLTGYLVLLPLAFRAALPRTPRAAWAALGIFPFVHSYPFHMGFWNFCYSLVLFFFTLGYWVRRRGRLELRSGAVFAVLGVVLYYAHSVSTSSALAVMASLLLFWTVHDLRRARGSARRRCVLRGWVRRGLATGAALLPTLALMAIFMWRQPKPLAYRPPLGDYVKHFFTLYGLVSYARWEIALAAAVALVLVAAVVLGLRGRGRRRVRQADGWFLAALLGAALYFAMPDAVADGAQLSDRLNLYPAFALLLWLGWSTARLAVVRGAAVALAALFLVATAGRLERFRAIDPWLAEYDALGAHIARGSVVLPLTLSPFGPREGSDPTGKKLLAYKVQPFTHAAGWLAAERGVVELDNSQAHTHHAPVRWRPEGDPFVLLPTRKFGNEEEPPCVNLRSYTWTGRRVDVVLVWGDQVAAERTDCGAMLLDELRRDYEPFLRSPEGHGELWRPKAVTAGR